MNYIYIFAGMFVSIIALFNRELLIQKQSFRIILALAVLVFFVGLVLHLRGVSADSPSGALFTPLPSLLIFRVCRTLFIKRYRREPKDTWFNWATGMAADRFFNILFFVSSFWIELLAIAITIDLAKATK